MRRRAPIRSACLASLLCCLTALTPAAPALAAYGNAADGVDGAQLVSADYGRREQGDGSTRFATISADGRYVAMETAARNLFADDDPDPAGKYRAGGIFRFNLQTRALVKVADGDLFRESDNAFLARGASNPSISANGRYVAFSTGQRLSPADLNDNVDIYVRDMDLPSTDPGAYVLASAREGSDAPAAYAPAVGPPVASPAGAEISAGVALSADGRRLVFRTEAASDLPARPGTDTAAGQVFVRDLDARTTTLISVNRNPGSGLMTAEPAGGSLAATISADGTTVAWTGRNAAAQTRFLAGENTDPVFNYYLWRRAPFGATDVTRRITGLADPDDPVCRQLEEADPGMTTVFSPNATGPCFGPLTDQEGNRSDISSQLPALSSDGYTVAFLTGAGPRPLVQSGPGLDLYLTDMHPGVSRKQGTVELTRDSTSGDVATSAAIGSLAISPDGRYLALTTSRTKFLLPALQLVGTTRAVPNPKELYVVDLQARTIERVSRSLSGGDPDAGVLEPASISNGAERIAFSSFAGNLFRGDANLRADAFVATRVPPASGAGGGPDEAAGNSSVQSQRGKPRLLVRAKTKGGGVVVLTISVPAAGTVDAVASARAGKPPRKLTVASRSTKARGKGSFNLVMSAVPGLRPALAKGAKLRARVKVTFKPASGGKKLRASTAATFSD